MNDDSISQFLSQKRLTLITMHTSDKR